MRKREGKKESGTRTSFPQNQVSCQDSESGLTERFRERRTADMRCIPCKDNRGHGTFGERERDIIILLTETKKKLRAVAAKEGQLGCTVQYRKNPIRLLTSFSLSASQVLSEQIGMPNYWNGVSNCVCKCHFFKNKKLPIFRTRAGSWQNGRASFQRQVGLTDGERLKRSRFLLLAILGFWLEHQALGQRQTVEGGSARGGLL